MTAAEPPAAADTDAPEDYRQPLVITPDTAEAMVGFRRAILDGEEAQARLLASGMLSEPDLAPEEGSGPVLPPFSGDTPLCAKCGYDEADTLHMEFGACLHGTRDRVIGSQPNDRLHRECKRCAYSWDEALAEPRRRLVVIGGAGRD